MPKGKRSCFKIVTHSTFSDIFAPASNADCGPIVLQRLQIASNWRALRRTFSYFQNHCSAPLPSSTAKSEEKVQNFPFARFASAQTSSVQIFDQTLTPKNLTHWPGKWPRTKRRPLCLPQAVVVVGRSSPEELAVNLSDGPRSNATIVPVFFVFFGFCSCVRLLSEGSQYLGSLITASLPRQSPSSSWTRSCCSCSTTISSECLTTFHWHQT